MNPNFGVLTSDQSKLLAGIIKNIEEMLDEDHLNSYSVKSIDIAFNAGLAKGILNCILYLREIQQLSALVEQQRKKE